MENEQQNIERPKVTPNFIIVKPQLQCEKELSKALQKIAKIKQDISDEIGELERKTADFKGDPVAVKRKFLVLIDKKSIESAITKQSEQLIDNDKKLSDSIIATKKTISLTLDLFKVLVGMESRLFQQLDMEVTGVNEFKESFHEWCRNQGITDDSLEELLEISFNRTCSLHEKINTVRHDLMGEVSKCYNELKIMNGSLKAFNTKFESLSKDTNITIKKTLNEKTQNFTDKVNSLIERQSNQFRSKVCEVDEFMRKTKLDYSQFINQNNHEFEKEKQNILQVTRNRIIWGIVCSIGISTIAAVLVVALLKTI